jgi:hypothetical protein
MKGYDPDGGAQTEGDHFRQFCPICDELVDMRDLAQLRRAFMMQRLRSAKAMRRRRAKRNRKTRRGPCRSVPVCSSGQTPRPLTLSHVIGPQRKASNEKRHAEAGARFILSDAARSHGANPAALRRSKMISNRGMGRCLEVSPVQAEIGLHNRTATTCLWTGAALFD